LGNVVLDNPSTGKIYVKVQNGYELDELHDVLITSTANGDLLKYDSATGLWKNAAQSTLTVAQSQVTNLTTDLAGKALATRTLSTTAPLAGGGDLSANRTLTIADASTTVKGAVQLTDSTSSTLTTTAATPNAVKSAYDLANGAVPKSTVTTAGDLIVASGAAAVERLGKGTTGQVLTAGASTISWATPAGGADGKLFVKSDATDTGTVGAGDGNNSDMALVVNDSSARSYARLVGPKSAGAWPANDAVDAAGNHIHLPVRSKTMKSSDLLPGWSLAFDPTWATGTAPSDIKKEGTFGGAWYSTSASSVAFFSRVRQSQENGGAMAFFSCCFTITALPEAGGFFSIGQVGGGGGGGAYQNGIIAQINSSGNLTLRAVETYYGVNIQIASGMTVAANDNIIIERFGYKVSAYKTAGATRPFLGPENGTSTNRPISGWVRDPSSNTTDEGYAGIYAASSFGLYTNSTNVRVSNVRFAG
jgi:hypothetical protein